MCLQIYIVKVAKLSPSSQVASKIKRNPLKMTKLNFVLNWLPTIVIRSALKFVIQKVVNHFFIMFQTRDITVYSFHKCDVTTHGPNNIGIFHDQYLKKGPKLQKGKNRQNYLLKLEMIRYKCHSDTVMSFFFIL